MSDMEISGVKLPNPANTEAGSASAAGADTSQPTSLTPSPEAGQAQPEGHTAERQSQNELKTQDADEEEYGYGQRTCMECGKLFVALHFAQICCSEECRKARRRNRTRSSVAKHMSRLHGKIERLEKELAVANGLIEALKLELATSKSQPDSSCSDITDGPADAHSDSHFQDALE